MPCKSLEKLRDLTDNLLAFPETVESASGFKEFQMDHGHCFSWYLYEQSGVGVHRWFNSRGTEFPKHAHKEKEWIVIFKGEIEIFHEDESYNFKSGEYIYVKPHWEHSAYFPTDCEYVTIMIPAAKDYPHAPNKW